MSLWPIVLLLLSQTIMVQVAKSFSFCFFFLVNSFCLYDTVFEMSLLFLYMMMMLTCILSILFSTTKFLCLCPFTRTVCLL